MNESSKPGGELVSWHAQHNSTVSFRSRDHPTVAGISIVRVNISHYEQDRWIFGGDEIYNICCFMQGQAPISTGLSEGEGRIRGSDEGIMQGTGPRTTRDPGRDDGRRYRSKSTCSRWRLQSGGETSNNSNRTDLGRERRPTQSQIK